MKIKEKFKEWLVHKCGGIMSYEFANRPVEIVRTEYPIKHLQFSYKHFLGTPTEIMDKEAMKGFAEVIFKTHSYQSRTINSIDTPELLNTIYSLYIACPPQGDR